MTATPAAKQQSARAKARKTPNTTRQTRPQPDAASYLRGAALWRVVLPARTINQKAYAEACFGVYVRDGFCIQAPPIARWMIGKSWDAAILPWLRKANAKGGLVEPGERLSV